jgi:hypothetical protein
VEQCQSLKALILEQISLTEDLLRVLGDLSRPGLEIKLKHCRIADATGAELAQILGRNRGPTKIDLCEIDNFVLANGLRGNSRLKSLNPRISSSPEDGNREVLAIADALRENKGLVDLDLKHQSGMSYETWDAVCDSLKTHPTLKVLNLWSMEPFGGAPSDPAVLKSRIQALANMLKVNMSLHTIRLPSGYSEHELFRGSVIPYLETNRVRAIQKHTRLRTVPRCWDERFLLVVPMQTAFGCFYQGMPKLPSHRRLRLPRWLRTSLRLLLLPLLQMLLLLPLLLSLVLPPLGILLQLVPLLLLMSILLLLVRSKCRARP